MEQNSAKENFNEQPQAQISKEFNPEDEFSRTKVSSRREIRAAIKKKSASLSCLPERTGFNLDACQTLPSQITSVIGFEQNLTVGLSHSTWYDTNESFSSSGEDISSVLSKEERLNHEMVDEEGTHWENANNKIERSSSEELDPESFNTDTKVFVRSSALDILAAFSKPATVSPQAEVPQRQPVIQESITELSTEHQIAKQENVIDLKTCESISWSQKPKNEEKKRKKHKKGPKCDEGSLSSVETPKSSQEKLPKDKTKAEIRNERRKKHKSTGFMNVFRRKSEAREESIIIVDNPSRERKPVQKSQSFNSINVPKNNQLNRMDSIRKIFRRQKADDKDAIEPEKRMEISSPIVKPSFQVNNNLVERDVIMDAQRNRAYQLDKGKLGVGTGVRGTSKGGKVRLDTVLMNKDHVLSGDEKDTLGVSKNGDVVDNSTRVDDIKCELNMETEEPVKETVFDISGHVEPTVQGNHSTHDLLPVPPVRHKHLERKRLSRATEDDVDDVSCIQDERSQLLVDDNNIEGNCEGSNIQNDILDIISTDHDKIKAPSSEQGHLKQRYTNNENSTVQNSLTTEMVNIVDDSELSINNEHNLRDEVEVSTSVDDGVKIVQMDTMAKTEGVKHNGDVSLRDDGNEPLSGGDTDDNLEPSSSTILASLPVSNGDNKLGSMSSGGQVIPDRSEPGTPHSTALSFGDNIDYPALSPLTPGYQCDDVFQSNNNISIGSNHVMTSGVKMPSVKHYNSVGSTDVATAAELKHGNVKKNRSFPGEILHAAPCSPPTTKRTLSKRASIFAPRPQFELSQEPPTLVTDLVPTSFPGITTDRRTQIVLELFTTERTYVRGLETIIELFQKPMKENMDEKDVDTMFSNINDILSVNKDLLFLLWEKLKHWGNDVSIGHVFIDMEERFKMYAVYCKNFDKADAMYKKKLAKNKEFERFLKSCYQDPLCQPGLDLPSYLITVIQRIPRYLLLLKDLYKKTLSVHADYDSLRQALIKMNKVAEYLNSQLQEVHSKKAMQELRSTVIGLKAYEVKGRKLLKEAEVCLMSPKKPYKCLLFNDIMVFAVQGPRDRSEIEMTLELRTLWFEDLKKFDPQTTRHDAIELFTPHRPYTMYASSRVEKRVWLQKLHVAIVNLIYGPNYDDADELDISRRKASDTYIDGSVYCGEYLSAKRHGHGVMAWPNRTRYEGSWVDDERHGHGELMYYTGEKYVGNWVADKKDGHGIQTYVNGDTYTGLWSKGKMHGKGEICFANGDSFLGDMCENEVEGEGELTCCTGLVYKGLWKKSKRQGKGHVFYPNGNEYMGDMFNDRICGLGKMIYFNRNEYTGEFLNEMRHGIGVFKSLEGMVYDGQWNNDFMNGQGKMTYPNGDQYTGTWHQNKRVGKGQMMYTHGNTYNGQWENDTMHGKGVMYYKDGSVYDGTWERGEHHGYGTIVYHDRTHYEGEFDNGFRHGRGKLIYYSNVCYVGEWRKDKFEGSGAFVDPNTQYSYQGDWVNGMRDGNGVEISYKTRYEGFWKADMRHGQGIEKCHAEHIFEGTWRENKKHGRGFRTLRSKVREEQLWDDGHLVEMSEIVAEDLPSLPRR